VREVRARVRLFDELLKDARHRGPKKRT
jgi:hypothetical protein